MDCTLGACAGEGGIGVVGLLTTFIVGFFFLSQLVHWAVQWEIFFVGVMWADFWSWRALIARSSSSHI